MMICNFVFFFGGELCSDRSGSLPLLLRKRDEEAEAEQERFHEDAHVLPE